MSTVSGKEKRTQNTHCFQWETLMCLLLCGCLEVLKQLWQLSIPANLPVWHLTLCDIVLEMRRSGGPWEKKGEKITKCHCTLSCSSDGNLYAEDIVFWSSCTPTPKFLKGHSALRAFRSFKGGEMQLLDLSLRDTECLWHIIVSNERHKKCRGSLSFIWLWEKEKGESLPK